MFNFNQVLMANEEILYEGKPVPGKGNKGIGGILFLLAFVAVWCGILIWSIVTNTGDGANGIDGDFIIMLLIGLGLGAFGIYAFVYNVFIKKKAVADDIYCLTNMRALKYEFNDQKLTYGFLLKYDQIEVQNEKDGFGDVYMGIITPDNLTEEQQMLFVKENLLNKKPNDMPIMLFECVERPYEVMQIALTAHNQLLMNLVNNNQNNINNN